MKRALIITGSLGAVVLLACIAAYSNQDGSRQRPSAESHRSDSSPATSIRRTLESLGAKLRPTTHDDLAALQKLGVSVDALAALFAHWPEDTLKVGTGALMTVREIAEHEWQADTMKHGLLKVGACNGGDWDPIVIDVSAGPPWPVYYIPIEEEGLYEEDTITKIKVAEGFETFLIEAHTDRTHPASSSEAYERLHPDE